VVWFCGLPGSGKTTIARGVFQRVTTENRGVNEELAKIAVVEMDSIRKRLFPTPTYSDEERDAAYRAFVLLGSFLSANGIPVLLDGVGHKLVWRNLARRDCPNFLEVYVKCSIEICFQRETARPPEKDGIRQKLYHDALERLKTGKKVEGLGKVPGVDEPFEESPHPEIIIDSSSDSPEVLIERTLQALSKFDPKLFSIATRI
jgi:adenylylsulfate kinase-like enzyme